MTAMYFDARINGDQLQRDIARINANLAAMTANFQKEGNEIDGISRRIGAGLAGAFSVFAVGSFIKDIARVRGEYQQLEVAFETMLGSKAKADQLMAEVVEFASRTPFELSEVAAGSKQLLAYGLAAEDIIPTLKSLGDVSSGLSVPMERLILNYGQVRTQLKMTGRELRDFQVAGVPIVAELAKNLDVTETKIADMVTAGEIGFKEVEEAFRSMTSEGGRFNNMMDKNAETITGLISNFADAFNKMLNAIGKQNEGIIAGSLKGAIQLVENYEEVIKVLKVLIVTYGAYKAAVIATGVATKVSAQYGIYDIATKKLQAAATLKAAAAQTALNVAQKVNPYGAVIAAIGLLVSLLTVYGKKADEAAKVSAEFTKNLTDEKKAITDAFSAIKTAKDGTEARTKAIQAVNEKYKDYLPNLLTEASNLYEVEKAQNAVTAAIAKTLAFKAQEDQLTNVKSNVDKELENFYKQINEAARKLNDAQKGQFTALIEGYKESLRQQFDQFGYFPEFSVNRINEIFKKIAGENLGGWALGDLDLALKGLIRSEVELEEKTDGLKTTYEEYLKALGIGQAPPEPVTLSTINERIDETKQKLDEAKKKLTELRSGTSTASTEDIQKQEETVKNLEKILETLTGISEKAQKELLKTAKEKLDALKELSDQEIELERNLQASKIAIMQEGAERQRKEAEFSYQQDIDRIKQQQEEYLKAWNAKQGFEPDDKGYISELPAEELAKFDQLRIDAETAKNNRIKEINRETAREIKSIWSEATDSFLSDADREITEINLRYDDLIARAKKAGETDFTAINQARGKAIEEATINEGLKRLDFEKDIENQRAEISTQGYNREVEIERKKLEITKKFARQKIELLKKSVSEESKLEIEQLQLLIESANIGLDELNRKIQDDTSQIIGSLSYAVSGLNSELGDALGNMANMFSNTSQLASNVASGNIIGAITSGIGIIGGFIELMTGGFNNVKESAEDLKEVLRIIDSIEKAKSNLTSEEWTRYTEFQMSELQKKIDERMKGYDPFGLSDAFNLSKLSLVIDYFKKISEMQGGLTEAQQKMLDQFIEWENEYLKLQEESWERLTGQTRNSIADSIIEGFQNGYKSAEDFADNFEQIMKTAVINSLKTQLIEGQLKSWYEGFAVASGDGLTEAEIAEQKMLWDSLIYSQRTAFEAMEKITGLNLSSGEDLTSKGLAGQIKGITEETAGLIAGQFFAFRELQQKLHFTALEQLDSINQSVVHLAEIASNTRHNSRLVKIEELLTSMESKL